MFEKRLFLASNHPALATPAHTHATFVVTPALTTRANNERLLNKIVHSPL